jgi:hypothetical protein
MCTNYLAVVNIFTLFVRRSNGIESIVCSSCALQSGRTCLTDAKQSVVNEPNRLDNHMFGLSGTIRVHKDPFPVPDGTLVVHEPLNEVGDSTQ